MLFSVASIAPHLILVFYIINAMLEALKVSQSKKARVPDFGAPSPPKILNVVVHIWNPNPGAVKIGGFLEFTGQQG